MDNRPHPVGWTNFAIVGASKDHWFDADGHSLCRRHRNNSFNILSKETGDGCAECARKLKKQRKE